MNNTLAENMLRFGVKNLKESDLKKISEALLTENPTPYAPYELATPTGLKFKDQNTWNTAESVSRRISGYKWNDADLLPPNEAWGRAFLDFNGTVATVKDSNDIRATLAELATGIFHISVFLGTTNIAWASTIFQAKAQAKAVGATFSKRPNRTADLIVPGVASLQAIDLDRGKSHNVPYGAPATGQGLGLSQGPYGNARWTNLFNTVKPQVEKALSYAIPPAATPAKPTTTKPAAPGQAAPKAGN
jgi:hypothetical protein